MEDFKQLVMLYKLIKKSEMLLQYIRAQRPILVSILFLLLLFVFLMGKRKSSASINSEISIMFPA